MRRVRRWALDRAEAADVIRRVLAVDAAIMLLLLTLLACGQRFPGVSREPKLYAYDKASGQLLAEVVLSANASGEPMTYMAGGKQYVAFPIGGPNITEELIALTLP